MDLKDTYHRIHIYEGDKWKTAFCTRYSYFEYLIMPFKLANTLATFQVYINKALAGYVNVFYVIYLNNILVYSNSLSDHKVHVKKIFKRL